MHPDDAAGNASRQAAPGPPPASALLHCVTETVTGRTGLLAEPAPQRVAAFASPLQRAA
ncbi:MAG TPA: hypothetical protein VG253_09395 [Streptosporangiaceae bacterium]|nr:hypothetical protein [Streptosporangiaceae bacterium]